MHHRRQLNLMLLPYGLSILLLIILPAIASFALAFYEYDALSPPQWLGTLNFILASTDELFSLSIQNSLALIILPVPVRVFGTLLIARLVLRDGRRIARPSLPLTLTRSAIYLPSIIPSAAYALAWLWILNPLFGPVNLILQAVGIMPPAWLADPQWAKPALILMTFWQIGEGFLVCLAALQDIPPELEEVAQLDGASWWGIFRYITLPIVAPILLLLMLRDAILTFQESFTNIYFMTQGGPYYATYTLPLFIYEQGFDLLFFGIASAALWVLYALTGVVVFALIVIARQWNVGSTEETFVI